MEYSSHWAPLIGLAALLAWSIDYWKWRGKTQFVLPSIQNLHVKRNTFLRFCLYLGGVSGLVLIIYASAGPRLPQSFNPGTIKVNDIFFTLDVSRSMLAIDLPPNRLEVAKKKILDFVQLRPKDRIGVVIFSEKVFTLLPLTIDHSLIQKMVKTIDVGLLGSGTNIGDALAVTIGRALQSETENKIIILLTDGVNNVGNMAPIQAAEVAKENGIKVYTIGIGTDNNAKLPIGRGFFGTQYQMIPGGSIDLKTLEKISEITGARTYVAKSEGSLEEILKEIERLERTDIKSNSQVVYDEKYYGYLLWGLFLFLLVESIRRFWVREYA